MGMGNIFGAAGAGAAAVGVAVGRTVFGTPVLAGVVLTGAGTRAALAGEDVLTAAAPLVGAEVALAGTALEGGALDFAVLFAAADFTLSVSRGRWSRKASINPLNVQGRDEVGLSSSLKALL